MSVHIDTKKIIKEWIDYNGHMNMAYYVLIFDQAWENILNKFQMGGEKAEESKRTTMVVELKTPPPKTGRNSFELPYQFLNLTLLKYQNQITV